tara:strand:+ start:2146 stop:3120 length:975 start_codon:yes stop_codon:yes gene_type:complete
MKWKLFLIVKIPSSIIFLTLLIEGLALLLSDTPKLRHPLDRLAANIKDLPKNAHTILLGDSVTQDVVRTYEILPREALVNLTTNLASGLIGSHLLLMRYIRIHKNRPTRVVIASSPEFFSYQPNNHAADIYLSSVFEKPSEISELRASGLVIKSSNWKPSILQFERSISDRLAYLMFSKKNATRKIKIANVLPKDTSAQQETQASIIELAERKKSDLTISQSALYSVNKLCELSKEYKFELVFLWAPIPHSVLHTWQANKKLKRLNDFLAGVTQSRCHKSKILDTNKTLKFSDYAFRDSDHLKRPYWTMVYAYVLKGLLSDRDK